MAQTDYAQGYEDALLEKKGEIERLTERLNLKYAKLEEYTRSLEEAYTLVCLENEALRKAQEMTTISNLPVPSVLSA